MIMRLSTFFSSSCMPSRALERAFLPSLRKGMVTTATVSIPISLAILAITGVAPVPVPPPIPAVIKSIWVPESSTFLFISSWLSRAALRPLVGLVPAPRPRPSWIFEGTGLAVRCIESVLQTMKLQPSMPCSYMYDTALQPPPPTPRTLLVSFDTTHVAGVIIILSSPMVLSPC